jgi:ferric-dicitrate binding protein FerR (iron transport regulator)
MLARGRYQMKRRMIAEAKARREAAMWLSRLSSTSVTVAALRAFQQWRQDPLNLQTYNVLSDAWSAELKSGRRPRVPELPTLH